MSVNLEMPKTKTPWYVLPILVVLAVIIWVLLFWLFGFWWGAILLFTILAMTTGVYTETVQGFDAHIVLNHFSGIQRTVFQGVNFVLPWEEAQHKVDLRVELNEVRGKDGEETYTAKDALMVVKYVYTIRPDASGNDAGEKVILYASYEPEAIKMAGRAIFSRSLSDYFAQKNGEELLKKKDVNDAVFGPGSLSQFEEDHGAIAEVTLEDVDFDEEAQRSRDMLSRATSFDAAIKKLKESMTKAEAVRVAKLMNFDDVKEWNFNVKGLENLQSANFAGGLAIPDDKKGGKKGGKK